MTHPIIQLFGSKKPNDPLHLKGRKLRTALVSSAVIGMATFNVYHVREQIAPGQQQFGICTERVSRDHQGDPVRDVIAVSTVVFLTSGTTYSRPVDWDNANNSIELIGGGQGGNNGGAGTSGIGGIGGGYAKTSNLTIAASTTYAIGAAGAAGLGNGGNTTWNSTTIVARGGGTATAQVGTTTRLGGNGGTNATAGGGGGGAAGLNAAGVNGANSAGGNGGAGGQGDGTFGGTGGAGGVGGAGGAGNPGAEYTATVGGSAGSGGGGGGGGSSVGGQGGLYGGGGGGGGSSMTGGAGRQGLIVITYTPIFVGGIRRRQYLRR